MRSDESIYKLLTFKESLKELKFPFDRDDIVEYDRKLYKGIKNMNEEIKDWNGVYKLFGILNSNDIIVDEYPFMDSRKTIYPIKNAAHGYENVYLELSFSIGNSDDIWFWKQKMSHNEPTNDMARRYINIRYTRQIDYHYYYIYCTMIHIKNKKR